MRECVWESAESVGMSSLLCVCESVGSWYASVCKCMYACVMCRHQVQRERERVHVVCLYYLPCASALALLIALLRGICSRALTANR